MLAKKAKGVIAAVLTFSLTCVAIHAETTNEEIIARLLADEGIDLEMLMQLTAGDAAGSRIMYAPDGRTLLVKEAEIEAHKNVGWYDGPITTMYAPDGRTLLIGANEIEAYKQVGWYAEPVATMYALDGRTETVLNTEVEAYQNVGWYTEPVRLMYAGDDRTEIVKESEVEAYKNVGWFDGRITTMYAADGRTLLIGENEIAAYKKVGWFLEPAVTVYAPDGRSLQIGGEDQNAYLSVGWFASRQEAESVQTASGNNAPAQTAQTAPKLADTPQQARKEPTYTVYYAAISNAVIENVKWNDWIEQWECEARVKCDGCGWKGSKQYLGETSKKMSTTCSGCKSRITFEVKATRK